MGSAKLPEKISERKRLDELEMEPSYPTIEASRARPAQPKISAPRTTLDPKKIERASKQRKTMNRKKAVRATDQNLIRENMRLRDVISEKNKEISGLMKKLDLLEKRMKDLQTFQRSITSHHTQSPPPLPRSSRTR